MWQGGRWEEISHLNEVGSDSLGEKKKIEEKKKKEEGKWSEKLYLLSKIYEDRAVGFHRSKSQSSSTPRELRMGTRIWGFLQNPRDKGFSPRLLIA